MSTVIYGIEDSVADRQLIRLFLETYLVPHDLTFGTNGQEAVDYLKKIVENPRIARPDLILSDLNLPVLTGVEVVEKIRELPYYDSVPIFILSSSTDKKEIREIESFPLTQFFHKPDTLEGFEAALQQISHMWMSFVASRYRPASNG